MSAIKRETVLLHKVNFSCNFFFSFIQFIDVVLLSEPANVAPMNSAARKEEEQQIQRAAEREGRRTRRRRGKH